MKPTRQIKKWVGQKLEIRLSKSMMNLHVIDWDKLDDNDRTNVHEYYLNDAGTAEVEAGRWVPFGVLGLVHHPDSIAEMSNDGVLVLAHDRVLWIRGDATDGIGAFDQVALFVSAVDEDDEDDEVYLRPPHDKLWNSSLTKAMHEDWAGAVADLEQLAKALPDEPDVHRGLAQCLEGAKRHDDALVAIDRALAICETTRYHGHGHGHC